MRIVYFVLSHGFALSVVLSYYLMSQDSFFYYFFSDLKTSFHHSLSVGQLVTNSSLFFFSEDVIISVHS